MLLVLRVDVIDNDGIIIYSQPVQIFRFMFVTQLSESSLAHVQPKSELDLAGIELQSLVNLESQDLQRHAWEHA